MKNNSERLLSIDVLRGFDMFFIVGGATFITALCCTFGFENCILVEQMKHVKWAGLAHHDTIFPLFLFLSGVSWPFSYASQKSKGFSYLRIHLRAIKRGAVLFALGLLFGGILNFKPEFRLMSVLGFIGISWTIAAILFMHIKHLSWRIVTAGFILIGYWSLLSFFAAPDAPANVDSYSLQGNIVSYLDRLVYPRFLLEKNSYDPESLFSVPSGVAIAFIGMLMGSVLKNDSIAKGRKAALIALSALVIAALGCIFHLVLGDVVVKKLWTSSFVLYTSAYSTAMLALFYWVIDVKGLRFGTTPFMTIGMNSIAIYLFMMLGVQRLLAKFFFTGLSNWIGEPYVWAVSSAGTLIVGWAFAHFLYRKKIFFKV